MEEAKIIFSSKNTIFELRELGKKYEIYMPSKIKKNDLIDLLIKEYIKKNLLIKKSSSKKLTTKKSSSKKLMTKKSSDEMISYADQYINLYPIPITYPVLTGYKLDIIESKRDQVFDLCEITPNFNTLSEHQIKKIYLLYNQFFFNNALPKNVEFVMSDQTKVGGSCGAKGCNYVIKLSGPILTKLFIEKESKSKKVCGLECNTRLRCAQIILEHEIIHLILRNSGEYLKEGLNTKIYGDHGNLFKDLSRSYFGHTEIYHHMLHEDDDLSDEKDEEQILENLNSKSEKPTKSTLKLGDTIKFYSGMKNGKFTGTIQTGTVIKINPKRVKVQVGNNTGTVPYVLII